MLQWLVSDRTTWGMPRAHAAITSAGLNSWCSEGKRQGSSTPSTDCACARASAAAVSASPLLVVASGSPPPVPRRNRSQRPSSWTCMMWLVFTSYAYLARNVRKQ